MALRTLKNNFGQGSAIEYAVVFFMVVAVAVGMSTYFKRSVQARVRGARNYMWAQVHGVYNQYYANRVLPVEYEPYYTQSIAAKDERSVQDQQQMPLPGGEGTYISGGSSATAMTSFSNVASPRHAD